MELFASLTSPYARKVRILAGEKALHLEFREVDAASKESPLAQLNPLGKVPVLVRDDGSVLFDSPVILEYLDGLSEPRLLPPSGPARFDVLLWQALADGMMDASVLRMLEGRRPPELQIESARARQDEKVSRAMAWANQRLRGSFACGDALTLADVALGSALEYVDLRNPHPWRDAHPVLARWQAEISQRPSFVATRPPGLPPA